MADQISGIQPDSDDLLYDELREIDHQADIEGTLTHEEVFAEARQWISELNTLDESRKNILEISQWPWGRWPTESAFFLDGFEQRIQDLRCSLAWRRIPLSVSAIVVPHVLHLLPN